jgi:hypothetical protein
LDAVPSVDLVLFDPPYIAEIVMYKVDEYTIDDYVRDVSRIKRFRHYMIFNDDYSKRLPIHQQDNALEYTVKGTGKLAGRDRIEMCFWR